MAEETISKYTVFATKFLRCAIETLKKVKTKGNNLDELTYSLNLGEYGEAVRSAFKPSGPLDWVLSLASVAWSDFDYMYFLYSGTLI